MLLNNYLTSRNVFRVNSAKRRQAWMREVNNKKGNLDQQIVLPMGELDVATSLIAFDLFTDR